MNYLHIKIEDTNRFGISKNPFLPAIIPLLAVALVYLFLLAQLPTEAQYEAGVGQNADHTACLKANAREYNRMYRDAQDDYADDLGDAEENYEDAELAASVAYYTASQAAIALLWANPVALAAALAIALAAYLATLEVAENALNRAEQHATDDFNFRTGELTEDFNEDHQACHDEFANPVSGNSYETDPNAIFNLGFNWDGYDGGCGVRSSEGDSENGSGNTKDGTNANTNSGGKKGGSNNNQTRC